MVSDRSNRPRDVQRGDASVLEGVLTDCRNRRGNDHPEQLGATLCETTISDLHHCGGQLDVSLTAFW